MKIEVQLVSPNMNVKTRNVNIDKCLFIVWSFTVAGNGRNYMQLGIAGCFPVEPRNRFCGLRTLLSAPRPQLTYSFCYAPFSIFSFHFLSSSQSSSLTFTISCLFVLPICQGWSASNKSLYVTNSP